MFSVNTSPNVGAQMSNYPPEQINLFFCDILQRGLDSMRSSIAPPPKPAEPAVAKDRTKQTRYWLNQLGPERKNDLTTWRRVGQALHSEHGQMGLPLWIEWTTSGQFPSSIHTARMCKQAFAKFRDTSRYSQGTIIKWATEDQEQGAWGANQVGSSPANQPLNAQPPTDAANPPLQALSSNGNEPTEARPTHQNHAQAPSQSANKKPQGGLVDIIGPFTPIPDFYYDTLLGLMDSSETKVVFYMSRLVFGYFTKDQNGKMVPKLQDRIAHSQLTDGRVTKGGKRLDYGTGLSEGAVKSALSRLIDFGIVIKLQNNNSRNEGNLYTLQLDLLNIDLEALQDRKLKKQQKNRQRTESARQARNKSEQKHLQPNQSEPASPDSKANFPEADIPSALEELATTPTLATPSQAATIPAPLPLSQEAHDPFFEQEPDATRACLPALPLQANNPSLPTSPAAATNEPFETIASHQQQAKAKSDMAHVQERSSAPQKAENATLKSAKKASKLPILPSLQAFNNELEQPFNEYTLQLMNQMAIEHHQMTNQEIQQLILKVNEFARIPAGFLYYTLVKGEATPPFVPPAQPAPAAKAPTAKASSIKASRNQQSDIALDPPSPSSPTVIHIGAAPPEAASISDITGILHALYTVNNEKPDDAYPMTALEALARKLEARGETEDTVLSAWQSCKQNGDRPLGAFVTWVNQGFIPTTKNLDSRLRHWGATNPNGGLISEYEYLHTPPTTEEIEQRMQVDKLLAKGKTHQEVTDETGVSFW